MLLGDRFGPCAGLKSANTSSNRRAASAATTSRARLAYSRGVVADFCCAAIGQHKDTMATTTITAAHLRGNARLTARGTDVPDFGTKSAAMLPPPLRNKRISACANSPVESPEPGA